MEQFILSIDQNAGFIQAKKFTPINKVFSFKNGDKVACRPEKNSGSQLFEPLFYLLKTTTKEEAEKMISKMQLLGLTQ